jgi:hypothetical protein
LARGSPLCSHSSGTSPEGPAPLFPTNTALDAPVGSRLRAKSFDQSEESRPLPRKVANHDRTLSPGPAPRLLEPMVIAQAVANQDAAYCEAAGLLDAWLGPERRREGIELRVEGHGKPCAGHQGGLGGAAGVRGTCTGPGAVAKPWGMVPRWLGTSSRCQLRPAFPPACWQQPGAFPRPSSKQHKVAIFTGAWPRDGRKRY